MPIVAPMKTHSGKRLASLSASFSSPEASGSELGIGRGSEEASEQATCRRATVGATAIKRGTRRLKRALLAASRACAGAAARRDAAALDAMVEPEAGVTATARAPNAVALVFASAVDYTPFQQTRLHVTALAGSSRGTRRRTQRVTVSPGHRGVGHRQQAMHACSRAFGWTADGLSTGIVSEPSSNGLPGPGAEGIIPEPKSMAFLSLVEPQLSTYWSRCPGDGKRAIAKGLRRDQVTASKH